MDNTIFIISCRLHRWNLSIRCKELLEFLKIKEYEIKAVNKCNNINRKKASKHPKESL